MRCSERYATIRTSLPYRPDFDIVSILRIIAHNSCGCPSAITRAFPTPGLWSRKQARILVEGVLDMAPYLEKYKSQLPNLFGLLGTTNMYNNLNPKTGTILAIESMFIRNNRISCFVREDLLKKLNIKEPPTLAEFEAILKAFKDNASKLLDADTGKMIPFSTSVDIDWRGDLPSGSFVPDRITDREMRVLGFDDRHLP
jgi:putative aldouronate transport system substrate-binding protein